jgi:hypothetical protein
MSYTREHEKVARDLVRLGMPCKSGMRKISPAWGKILVGPSAEVWQSAYPDLTHRPTLKLAELWVEDLTDLVYGEGVYFEWGTSPGGKCDFLAFTMLKDDGPIQGKTLIEAESRPALLHAVATELSRILQSRVEFIHE